MKEAPWAGTSTGSGPCLFSKGRISRQGWRSILMMVAAVGASTLVGQEKAAQRSVWEGVYSDAQANRGQLQYERSCAGCHHSDLQGDSAEDVPALADEDFLARWSGQTVKDLFEKINKGMPANNPGSLSDRQSLDIVAYLLQANKFPSAKEELGGDMAQLVFAKSSAGTKP